MLYIFEQPDTMSDAELARALALLPAERRAKALRLSSDSLRKQTVIGYLLLCAALRERGIFGQPTLAYGAHGKPYLPAYPSLHFSISHCRAAVVCALCEQPVGVDVQELLAPSARLAARLGLAANSDARALTESWTRRESSAKCHGNGLTAGLKALPFAGDSIKTVWRGGDTPYALSLAIGQEEIT